MYSLFGSERHVTCQLKDCVEMEEFEEKLPQNGLNTYVVVVDERSAGSDEIVVHVSKEIHGVSKRISSR